MNHELHEIISSGFKKAHITKPDMSEIKVKVHPCASELLLRCLGNDFHLHVPSRIECGVDLQKTNGEWKVTIKNKFQKGRHAPYIFKLKHIRNRDCVIIWIFAGQHVRCELHCSVFETLQSFTLEAPNITTTSSQTNLKKTQVELISEGDIRISSHPLKVQNIVLTTKDGNVYISTGSLVCCKVLTLVLPSTATVFVNGAVQGCKKLLHIRVMSGHFQTNVDGTVGCSRLNQRTTANTEIVLDSGDITNFGALHGGQSLIIRCRNLLPCDESKTETAQRSYSSFISLQKELGRLQEITHRSKMNSSFCDDRLLDSVKQFDCETVVSLLNRDVDPGVKIKNTDVLSEIHRLQSHENPAGNEKIDHLHVMRGCFTTFKWKHGEVCAPILLCFVSETIHDCSQLKANLLNLHVDGDVKVVKPWTWECGEVGGKISGNLTLNDNIVLQKFRDLEVSGNFTISKTSFVLLKQGGELTIGGCFTNDNVLLSNGNLELRFKDINQAPDAMVMCNKDLMMAINGDVERSWRGNVYVAGDLYVLVNLSVACDAYMLASESFLYFPQENSQFIAKELIVCENGDLHLEAKCESKDYNFVLTGNLFAHGIEGVNATLKTSLNRARIHLTDVRSVNVRLKRLLIEPKTSFLVNEAHYNEEVVAIMNVSCFVVEGNVCFYVKQCTIHAESFNNNGHVFLKPNALATETILLTLACKDFQNFGEIYSSEANMEVLGVTMENDKSGTILSEGRHFKFTVCNFNNSGEVLLKPHSAIKTINETVLYIECLENLRNSGRIFSSKGNMHVVANALNNDNGVLSTCKNLHVTLKEEDNARLAGELFAADYVLIESMSIQRFIFSAITEQRKCYFLPKAMEVRCKTSEFIVDTELMEYENASYAPECLFFVKNLLKFEKECRVNALMVEYSTQKEVSHLTVVGDFETSLIRLRSESKGSELLFIGSATVEKSFVVEDTFQAVSFDSGVVRCSTLLLKCDLVSVKSELHCSKLEGKSMIVAGQIICKGSISPCILEVSSYLTISGFMTCEGDTELYIGENLSADENSHIVFSTSLRVTADEKGNVYLNGSSESTEKGTLDVTGNEIEISGVVQKTSSVTFCAEENLTLTEKGALMDCDAITLQGELMTLKGNIENFNSLCIEPWSLLNSGRIVSNLFDSTISLSSDLALINSGIFVSQKTDIVVPFLLSLPGKDIAANEVFDCKLVGVDEVSLESIACFLGGSTLMSNKLVRNNTVLLVKFMSNVLCTPMSQNIETLSNALEHIKGIHSEYTKCKENQFLNFLTSYSANNNGSEPLNLGFAEMFSLVNAFVGQVKEEGVGTFENKIPDLVDIITKECKRAKLEVLKEKLRSIPKRARKLRMLLKKGKVKLKGGMRSLKRRFGFSEKETPSKDAVEGIHESGEFCFSNDVVLTDSICAAFFEETFQSEGVVVAGELIVKSEEITMSKRQKRAVTVALYAEKMDIENIESGFLDANGKSIKMSSVRSDIVNARAKVDLDVTNVKSNTALFQADKSLRIKNVQSENLVGQSEGRVIADNVKGGSVVFTGDQINAEHVRCNDLNIDSTNTVTVTDIRTNEAEIRSKNDVNIGDIKVNDLQVQSTAGRIQATGRIDAKTAAFDGDKDVSLIYKKGVNQSADHSFKNLSLKTKKIRDINSMLNTEGIYKDLKICDQLGLEVSDQDVILSRCNFDKDFSLDLKSKSINIDNSSLKFNKGARLESEKSFNVAESTISSDGNVALKSKKDLNLRSANVLGGGCVSTISEEGSINMKSGSIKGQDAVVMKARKDILIESLETQHSSDSKRNGFFSSKSKSTTYSSVSQAEISSSSSNVLMKAEEGKILAEAVKLSAKENMIISAKKSVKIKDKVTVRKEVEKKRKWFSSKKTERRTEESHASSIDAGGHLLIASQDSDVAMIGTQIRGGDVTLLARRKVSIKDRKLETFVSRESSGLSFSLDKGLSIYQTSSALKEERLAGCSVNVGGSFAVKSEMFEASNAIGINVNDNFNIDSRTVEFKGADLKKHSTESTFSVGFGVKSFDVSASQAEMNARVYENQHINVGRKTVFTDARKVEFSASNLNTGSIAGKVDELNIISKQDEISMSSTSTTVGFYVCTGGIVPNKLGVSKSEKRGRFVNEASGLHCRSSISKEEFCVDSLKLTGSSVTAKEGIDRFAKDVISNKINSYVQENSRSFSVGADTQSVSLGFSMVDKTMKAEHVGTIASLSGQVSNDFKREVNTDYTKHARITEESNTSFGMNVCLEKKGISGDLQINDIACGFAASKKNVGFQAQKGDNAVGFAVGKDGASLNVRSKETQMGIGVNKKNVQFDVKGKDMSIGATVGKGKVSGKAGYKQASISGSTSKTKKSTSIGVGDFKTGIKKEKQTQGKGNAYSGKVSVGDNFKLKGKTSKEEKAGSFKFGKLEGGGKIKKSEIGSKKEISGNIKAGDNFSVRGSNSDSSNSLNVKCGEYEGSMKRKKDKGSGETVTSGIERNHCNLCM